MRDAQRQIATLLHCTRALWPDLSANSLKETPLLGFTLDAVREGPEAAARPRGRIVDAMRSH